MQVRRHNPTAEVPSDQPTRTQNTPEPTPMTSNIRVTYPEQLQNSEYSRDYCRQTMTGPLTGKSCPTGLAGYVVGDCTVVCHNCIGTEESDYDDPYPIFGDSEADYPGNICEDCGKTLDTHILVYRRNDPELYYRLEQAESLGLDGVPTLEQIGDEAMREAYSVGWDTVGQMHEGSHAEGGEFEDSDPEPTRHGGYDTNILPKLRAIAGYGDAGHGTYQECYYSPASDILSEGVVRGYCAGYRDRSLGREYGESLEV